MYVAVRSAPRSLLRSHILSFVFHLLLHFTAVTYDMYNV